MNPISLRVSQTESSGREGWLVESRSVPCTAEVSDHFFKLLKVCTREEHSYVDPARRAQAGILISCHCCKLTNHVLTPNSSSLLSVAPPSCPHADILRHVNSENQFSHVKSLHESLFSFHHRFHVCEVGLLSMVFVPVFSGPLHFFIGCGRVHAEHCADHTSIIVSAWSLLFWLVWIGIGRASWPCFAALFLCSSSIFCFF